MALRLGAAAVALLLSGSVFSAVTITVPEEIVVLAVNGQEVSSGLLRQKSTYKVDSGQSAISVRYQDYFEHLNGEHDIVKSGVVTITTPELKDNASYRLALVGSPKSFENAKKFAEQPTVALFDSNNNMLVQQTGANNEAKPWFSTGFLSKVVDLTDNQTPKNQPAPVYAKVENNVSTPTTRTNTEVSTTVGNEKALIELWQKSSKAERQKFMTWLAGQTN